MSDEKENEKQHESWDFEDETSHFDDPLLRCLLIVSKLHDKSISAQALKAGLPLVDNKLTPELFIRAATRAELSAQIIKRPIEKITQNLLPAVLLLNDKQACVLVDCGNSGSGMQIVQPETGSGAMNIDKDKLNEMYSGYAILIKPEYRFSKRSHELLDKEPKNWFWGVLSKAWPVYSEVFIASFLINVFALAMPLFIMNVYDRVVPNYAFNTLWVLGIGIIIVIMFDFCMRLVRAYFIDHAGKNIDIELSSSIFEQIIGMRMDVRPKSVGSLSNSVNAFESFRDLITSASVAILIDFPFTLLFILVIWMIGGPLALIPLLIIPIVLGVSFLVQMPIQKKITDLYRYASEKQATLLESLSGAETLKAISAESAVQHKWETSSKKYADENVKIRLLGNIIVNFSAFMQNLAAILIIIFGVYLISAGSLSVGALVAATILTGRALAPVTQVAGLISRYYQSVTSLKTLNHIMNAPVDRPHNKTHLHRPKLDGSIEFAKVDFNYPESNIAVLDNCTFRIKAGEKVALIGRIGSGKSTIARLLTGLYQPTGGDIYVDGTELLQIDPADLRRNIGYVPQDIVLFDGTVRQNIVYGDPYVTDKIVETAAHISGVDIFTKAHPDGYDMQVGERGSLVSGGQAQSIAIARALIHDPPILILDEPSSAMDDRSETLFQERLKEYMVGKTLIVITHRASTLELADRIIIVDRGGVVADGPKEQVLDALAKKTIKVA